MIARKGITHSIRGFRGTVNRKDNLNEIFSILR